MPKLWLLIFCCYTALHSGKAQYVGCSDAFFKKIKKQINSDTALNNFVKKKISKANIVLSVHPKPIAYISTAGRLKGDPIREESIKCTRDFDKIWTLAFVYKYTSEEKYLKHLSTYLSAWCAVNRASGEPINETKLEPLIEAFDMAKGELSHTLKDSVLAWLETIATKQISSREGGKKAYNNFQSHRLKIVGLIGLSIGNATFIAYADKGLKEQIRDNLFADGSSFDFKERDALHYHCYTLEPLLRLTVAFSRYGKNYYSITVPPRNSSLKKSVDFLIPFVNGTRQHKEFIKSNVDFDKKRSNNNQKEYTVGKLFEPKEALYVIEMASYFDSSLKSVIINTLNVPYSNSKITLYDFQ